MRKFGPIYEMSSRQVESLLELLGFRCTLPRKPFSSVVTLRLVERDGHVAFEEVIPGAVYTEAWGMRRVIEEAVGRTGLAAMVVDDHVVVDEEEGDEVPLSELEDVE